MQKLKLASLASHLRLPFALLSALILFAGCGSDQEREEKPKKPASERVAILRERFDQLESDLNEMERDLAIQKKRIEKTRETAKAIRRSLIRGNLKGYSIDTITSEPVLAQRAQEKKERKQEKLSQEAEKEEAENSFLNAALIILFFIFIIVIFAVALKDRKQDLPPYAPVSPDNDPRPNDLTPEPIEEEGNYGELGGGTGNSFGEEIPPPSDETHGNEDRHQ